MARRRCRSPPLRQLTRTEARAHPRARDLRGHVNQSLGPVQPALALQHEAERDCGIEVAARELAAPDDRDEETERDEDASEGAVDEGRGQRHVEAGEHAIGEHAGACELEEDDVEPVHVTEEPVLEALRQAMRTREYRMRGSSFIAGCMFASGMINYEPDMIGQ